MPVPCLELGLWLSSAGIRLSQPTLSTLHPPGGGSCFLFRSQRSTATPAPPLQTSGSVSPSRVPGTDTAPPARCGSQGKAGDTERKLATARAGRGAEAPAAGGTGRAGLTFSTSALVTLMSASIFSKYCWALSASLQSRSNRRLLCRDGGEQGRHREGHECSIYSGRPRAGTPRPPPLEALIPRPPSPAAAWRAPS